jgi:hypothetical protein
MTAGSRSVETELAIIANEMQHLREELKSQGREIHEIKIENARTKRLVNLGTGGFIVLVFIGGIVTWLVSNGINLWSAVKH